MAGFVFELNIHLFRLYHIWSFVWLLCFGALGGFQADLCGQVC